MSRMAEHYHEEQQRMAEFAQVKATWTEFDLIETDRRLQKIASCIECYQAFGFPENLSEALTLARGVAQPAGNELEFPEQFMVREG